MTAGPILESPYAVKGMTGSIHSAKTRWGIAKARSQGAPWGQYGRVLAEKNREDANAFAETMRPTLLELGAINIRTPHAVARALNARGIPARKGGIWHPSSVARLLKRLGRSLQLEIELRGCEAGIEFFSRDPQWKADLARLLAFRDALLREMTDE